MDQRHFLRIGGITIGLRCDDPAISWSWDEPSRRFLTGPSRADLEVEVRGGDAPAEVVELLFDSAAVWRLFRTSAGYRIECRSEAFGNVPYKILRVDEAFARGTIHMTPLAVTAHVSPLEYPLDELLVSNLLGRGRGIELHACGIVDRHGMGRLFVGASGAGKTTTARLWSGTASSVVSDDRVILREEEGMLWMYGTPWHGEAELSAATRVPLADVQLLVQAGTNELRALSPAAAVAKLFACAFPLFHDPQALDFTLAFLARLTGSVPVRELHFTRDERAVAVMQQG